MSFTALRQAAFGARRTYTIGGVGDSKLAEKGGSEPRIATASAPSDRTRTESNRPTITLEPHWQAAIESATD